jgi:hypothetical protein
MGQTQPVQVYLLVTEGTIEERMLGTLSAKHDLSLAALDVDSDVSEVELRSGMDELKRRLEQLVGHKPDAPVDVSLQREVESEARRLAEKRDKVAAAGGELLGAAIKLLGELVPTDRAPDHGVVQQVKASLNDCVARDEDGRLEVRFTLPSDDALESLAAAMAKLLVASGG